MNATTNLKVLAAKVLERNSPRNTSAKTAKKQCNKESLKNGDLLHHELVINRAIAGLGLELIEVLKSPLFGGSDFADIQAGTFTPEQIRLYVASWIINDKQFPTPIHQDYEARLTNKFSNTDLEGFRE